MILWDFFQDLKQLSEMARNFDTAPKMYFSSVNARVLSMKCNGERPEHEGIKEESTQIL